MVDSKKRKEYRFSQNVDKEIPTRLYNAIIGGIIAYGLLLGGLVGALVELKPEHIIPFIIGYFIYCIIGCVLSKESNNPIISFIGYNLVVVPISVVVDLAVSNTQIQHVVASFIVTGLVVAVMIVVATIKPKLFNSMGTTLLISLSLAIIGEIVAMLLGYSGGIFNWAFVIIFSIYVGYDWCVAQEYAKTLDNAVDSALDLYLDIVNLMLQLLEIFADSDN